MVVLMVLFYIVSQSVLMVCIDENRQSDLFFDQSNHVWPSLIPDDHLILFLFPPVIHTRVTRSVVLSALLPLISQVVFIFLHKPSLLEESICSILLLSTQSKPVQSALIWLLKQGLLGRIYSAGDRLPHTCPAKLASKHESQ